MKDKVNLQGLKGVEHQKPKILLYFRTSSRFKVFHIYLLAKDGAYTQTISICAFLGQLTSQMNS
jgi:hypothetical protein